MTTTLPFLVLHGGRGGIGGGIIQWGGGMGVEINLAAHNGTQVTSDSLISLERLLTHSLLHAGKLE